ncbi:MAG TPA: histidinol-phosphatase [Thermoanaerobaculia bacterium]|jgi:histidinol-phosphatase
MGSDLELALSLADAADAITMKHYRSSSLAVRTKIDRSPVSEADEAVERMIRERLASEHPDDAIVGEEYGVSGTAARRWIVDPIDGTKNYVRGIPVFATLIGLEVDGVLTVGVVSAPALHRRWWASRGNGAFIARPEGAVINVERMHVSAISTLEEAHVGYDEVKDFDKAGSAERFLALTRGAVRSRGFGDFWAHMLVAEGAIEIAIEPAVAWWDMAAVQVIVEEAGGRFTDLEGRPRADGGSALSTNGLVHETVLELFR